MRIWTSDPIDDKHGNSTIRAMSMPRSLEPLTVRIALHGRPVWVYPETSLMDVSGSMRAILNQKSDEVFSISPDATVFEAIEMMDAKNVGALLVIKQERLDHQQRADILRVHH